MISYKSSYRPRTHSSAHAYFALGKTPHCPARFMGGVEKRLMILLQLSMPVIPVSLNDKMGFLENKVRQESPKHGLVHIELQPPLLKFIAEKTFYSRHSERKALGKSMLARLLNTLWSSMRSLPFRHDIRTFQNGRQLCRVLRAKFLSKLSNSHLGSRLRRWRLVFGRTDHVVGANVWVLPRKTSPFCLLSSSFRSPQTTVHALSISHVNA